MSPPVPAGATLTADRPTVPAVVGVVLAGVAFWLLSGLTGLLLALGLGLSLVVFPTIFVFALGQFVLAVLLPADASLELVALAEAPLLLVLVDTRPGLQWVTARSLVTVALGLLPIVAGGLLLGTVSTPWAVAGAVVAVVAAAGYALDRYAAVMFPPDDAPTEGEHAGE